MGLPTDCDVSHIYLLTDGGMVGVNDLPEKYYGQDYDITLDGYTATIEFPADCYGIGSQVTYEQNIVSGFWMKTEDDRCRGEGHEDFSGAMIKVNSMISPGATAILAVLLCIFY